MANYNTLHPNLPSADAFTHIPNLSNCGVVPYWIPTFSFSGPVPQQCPTSCAPSPISSRKRAQPPILCPRVLYWDCSYRGHAHWHVDAVVFGQPRSMALGYLPYPGRQKEVDTACSPFLLGATGNYQCCGLE